MSDLGQDVFTSFISHAWNFLKQESEVRKVKAMTPAELGQWRRKELRRIHEEAVKIAGIHSENALRKLGTTRADSIRRYEVVLRNERGVLFSQYLLEGMDVRGLDMSRFRNGTLNQQHIQRATGDQTTKLPPDIVTPAPWQAPETAAVTRSQTDPKQRSNRDQRHRAHLGPALSQSGPSHVEHRPRG